MSDPLSAKARFAAASVYRKQKWSAQGKKEYLSGHNSILQLSTKALETHLGYYEILVSVYSQSKNPSSIMKNTIAKQSLINGHCHLP